MAALKLLGRGGPRPLLDGSGRPIPGSISEKVFVSINGMRQGMFIQSKDPAHPVLLFLHGGMPEYFLTERYPTGLENDFTVAWWEQRGAGLSYGPGIPPETMTLEQFIADTLSVADLEISESLWPEIKARREIEKLEEPRELKFDRTGNLT